MTTISDRPALIEQQLRAQFAPQQIEIIDDSAHHAGHASAGGAGHFRVRLISEAFAGKRLLERHRMVYAALDSLMPEHIHALSIEAKTPDEVSGTAN